METKSQSFYLSGLFYLCNRPYPFLSKFTKRSIALSDIEAATVLFIAVKGNLSQVLGKLWGFDKRMSGLPLFQTASAWAHVGGRCTVGNRQTSS